MPRSASVSVMASKRAPESRPNVVSHEQGARKVHLRRTHKKSHLGCQTCKQRRIKCDEKLPCCTQCQRAKLDCPYEKYNADQVKEHEYKRHQAVMQAAAAAAQAANDTVFSSTTCSSSSENISQSTHLSALGNSCLDHSTHPQPYHQPTNISSYSQINPPNIPPNTYGLMMPPPSTTSSVLSTTITASFASLPSDQASPHFIRHDSASSCVTDNSSHTDLFDMSTNGSTSQSSTSSIDPMSSAITPYSQPQYNPDNNRNYLDFNNIQHQPSHYPPKQEIPQVQRYSYDPSSNFQRRQFDTRGLVNVQPTNPGSHFNFYNKGIPNVTRISQITDLQRRNLLNTVNLVRQGFETEMMRKAYSNWMSNTMALAYHHECLFHSVMAFSFGFQALKTGNQYYRNLSDKHRVLALKKFNTELENVSPANTDALLGTSLILYWDAMYQVDTIYSYINMCRGLGAILEKVQINSSTTQTAICTTESLAQAIKSILYPRYPHYFFQELIDKIALLESLVMADNADTQKEYYYLRDYTNRVYGFIKSGIHSTQNSIYDPNVLYDFIKEWISNFPCLTFSIDFIKSDACVVLYAFFDSVSHALDAVFPEARYLFQFSFIGPIDLIGIENSALVVSSQEAFVHLEYPLRLVSFFKKRAYQLSGLFMTSDPLLMSPSGVPLYRSRQVGLVSEKAIHSFGDDLLKHGFDEFMPTFNPEVHNFMDSTKTPPPSSSNNGIGFGHNTQGTTLPPLFANNAKSSASSPSTFTSALSTTRTSSPVSSYAGSSNFNTTKSPKLGDTKNIATSISSPRTSLPSLSAVLSPKDQMPASPSTSGSACNSPKFSISKGAPLPPLSSLSMGSFKTYFDDRLDILRHFAPNQPDLY